MADAPAPKFSVGRLLAVAYQKFARQLSDRLIEEGWTDVTIAHGKALELIGDDGSRVRDMADQAGMTHQAMTQLVEHLETHGYAERLIDVHDKRAKLVSLTDMGRRHLDSAWAHISSIEMEWTGKLGAQQLDELRRHLETLTSE